MSQKFEKKNSHLQKQRGCSCKQFIAILTAVMLLLSASPLAVWATGSASSKSTKGTALSVDGIIEAGITDPCFAEAIYDSIVVQPDCFVDDRGDPDPENTLESNTYPTVAALLEHFGGDINASGKGIAQIEGFPLLRRADSIDISNNQITSLLPIEKGNISETDNYYYGKGNKNPPHFDAQNVQINVKQNPLREIPRYLGGMLKVLGEADDVNVTLPEKLIILASGENDTFDGVLNIDLKLDGDRYPLLGTEMFTDGLLLDETTGRPIPSSPTEAKMNSTMSDNGQITFDGIASTGGGIITDLGASPEGEYHWNSASTNGMSVTIAGVTPSWIVSVSVDVYTKAEAIGSVTTHQGVTLTKIAEDTGEPLPGATFVVNTANGEKVAEGTTDLEGKLTIGAGLPAGEYVLVETVAPDGYLVDDTPIPFTLVGGKDGKIEVTGGAGPTLETESGTETIDGAFMLGGSTDKVDIKITPPENGSLKELVLTWTEGNKGGTAGSDTFTEEQAEAKIQECRDLYQNVTVSAEFTQEPIAVTHVNPVKPAEINLTASKAVEAPDDKPVEFEDGEFAFTLVNDPASPSPSTPTVNQTKPNEAGKVKFNTIFVYEPGAYQFLINEVTGDNPKYLYDTTQYGVKVTVEKNAETNLLEVTETTYTARKDDTETPAESAAFLNKLRSLPFSFTKVSQEADAQGARTPLLGAGFTLYREGSDEPLLAKESDADGKVDFGNLQSGSYRLVETKAPDGYQLPVGQWKIVVDVEKNSILISALEVNGQLPPAAIGSNAEGFQITNLKQTVLPLAGASGSFPYYAIGVLFMSGAAFVLGHFVLRKKVKAKTRRFKIHNR